ncbi:AAA family ATPase [Terrabacter sp. 2YAF2]|uniref:AAA family ATPase n=1 Tax=Terrabacter sp. 2YAF2 TaxID=3233026 RepID=UPI003F95F131
MTTSQALRLPRWVSASAEDAAVWYAEAGWYVVPVAAESDDPASLLGPDWAERSSRKASKIRKWFHRWPDARLALDLARSGAVAFRLLDSEPRDPSVELLTVMAMGSVLMGARPGQAKYLLALEDGKPLPSGDYGPLEGELEVLCDGEVAVLPDAAASEASRAHGTWNPPGTLATLPGDLHGALLEAAQPPGAGRGAVPVVGAGASATTAPAKAALEGLHRQEPLSEVARGDGSGGAIPADVRRTALEGARRQDGPSQERSSWAPRNLSLLVDGPLEPLQASLMLRADGAGLLYPGMVHTFFGEPESGKSLLLQWACVEAVTEGKEVLYVDFESDEMSILRRLLALGAKPKHIHKRFTYVRPETDLSSERDRTMWQQLLERPFSLAVIDGVTEALDLFGYKSTDNDNVARWMRTVPRDLAQKTGGAVALIDHVTKSREGRGRFPVGAQAKLAAISGAAYTVEASQRLVEGGRGEFTLRLVKDRPGGVGRHAVGKGRTPLIARATVTSLALHEAGSRSLILALEPPGDDAESDSETDPGGADLDIHIRGLVADNPGLTQTQLMELLGGNTRNTRARLNDLEAMDVLRVELGPRKSKKYFLRDEATR